MKKLLLCISLLLFISPLAFSQSTASSVSNHVYSMCDDSYIPVSSSNQKFFMILHKNSKAQLLCGSTLERAVSNGPQKSGTWHTSGNKVWVVWSDGNRTSDFSYRSGNLVGTEIIWKDLGTF